MQLAEKARSLRLLLLAAGDEGGDLVGEALRLVDRDEGARVGDLDDPRVRDFGRQPLGVLQREDLVAGRPGEQQGEVGGPQLLCSLQRLALVHPRRHLLQVAFDAGIVQAGLHP